MLGILRQYRSHQNRVAVKNTCLKSSSGERQILGCKANKNLTLGAPQYISSKQPVVCLQEGQMFYCVSNLDIKCPAFIYL